MYLQLPYKPQQAVVNQVTSDASWVLFLRELYLHLFCFPLSCLTSMQTETALYIYDNRINTQITPVEDSER